MLFKIVNSSISKFIGYASLCVVDGEPYDSLIRQVRKIKYKECSKGEFLSSNAANYLHEPLHIQIYYLNHYINIRELVSNEREKQIANNVNSLGYATYQNNSIQNTITWRNVTGTAYGNNTIPINYGFTGQALRVNQTASNVLVWR